MKQIQFFLMLILVGSMTVFGTVPICCATEMTEKDDAVSTDIHRMQTVVDLREREVNISVPITRIVALRAALGLLCYMNLAHKVVGVENIESESSKWIGSIGRSYRMANPHLGTLPIDEIQIV